MPSLVNAQQIFVENVYGYIFVVYMLIKPLFKISSSFPYIILRDVPQVNDDLKSSWVQLPTRHRT